MRLLKALAGYLKEKGIETKLLPRSVEGNSTGSPNEPALALDGQTISKIRVVSAPYDLCDDMGNLYRFQYEIALDHRLSRHDIKQIKSRLNLIRERNILGIATGDITGVKWEGQKLAEELNSDTNLTSTLLDCAKSTEYSEIEVEVLNPTTVEISGPWFSEAPPFLQSDKSLSNAVLEDKDKLHDFEIYQKIARRIIETAQIKQTVR